MVMNALFRAGSAICHLFGYLTSKFRTVVNLSSHSLLSGYYETTQHHGD